MPEEIEGQGRIDIPALVLSIPLEEITRGIVQQGEGSGRKAVDNGEVTRGRSAEPLRRYLEQLGDGHRRARRVEQQVPDVGQLCRKLLAGGPLVVHNQAPVRVHEQIVMQAGYAEV